MSAESTTRHTIDKVEVFEVIIQVFWLSVFDKITAATLW